MNLTRDGVTVTEIAPGVDLERDVLAQAEFPLQVAPDLRPWTRRCSATAPIGLKLPEDGDAVHDDLVSLAVDGPVATVTLERAGQAQRADAGHDRRARGGRAARIDADAALRCVILTGDGDRAFCAGGDIAAWAALDAARDVAALGQARATGSSTRWARLRRAADRRAQRPRAGRRPGAGRRGRHPHRRERAQASACRRPASASCPAGRARSGWCALRRRPVKCLALTGERIDAGERWRSASSTRSPDQRRAPGQARRRSPATIAGARAGRGAARQAADQCRPKARDGRGARGLAGALAADTDGRREGRSELPREAREHELRGAHAHGADARSGTHCDRAGTAAGRRRQRRRTNSGITDTGGE